MSANVSSSHYDVPLPIRKYSKFYKHVKEQRSSIVNLIDSEYKDEAGRPYVFPVVREVEMLMANGRNRNGSDTEPYHHEFEETAAAFLMGPSCQAIRNKRVVSLQTLGGTGGLRLAAEFSHQVLRISTVYLPNTASVMEVGIFQSAGYSQILRYPHNPERRKSLTRLDLLDDLNAAQPGSTVLFQADDSCNRLVPQDLKEIVDICQRRGLFVMIDSSYQGLISGDPNKDAQFVRQMVDYGLELMIVQSFSYNFGLYNERVGNLCVVTKDGSEIASRNIRSQLINLNEEFGLSPPYHGADVVARILGDSQLYNDWRDNLTAVVSRFGGIRQAFYSRLTTLLTPGHCDGIFHQRGLFANVNLQDHHIKYLKNVYQIYAPANGSLCLTGLNDGNVNYVAEAISDVLKNVAHDSKL